MSARAGVVVTGTEVLTGIIGDKNGPWLSERLRDLGVDHAHTAIVGDRPEDVRAALDFFASQGMDLIVTSGGLGPTEDDLTARVVADFAGRELALDEALEGRIATILEPVGTAPGFVVPPAEAVPAHPTVVVLPGPPRELQPMWETAVRTEAFRAATAGATEYRARMLRLFGIPESEIAETLRVARSSGVPLDALEITTCLRRGEIEIATRYEPPQEAVYDAFAALVRERHEDTLFSEDEATIDEIVADLLRSGGVTIAVAESCTGGLMAGRLTDLAGSSEYVVGGLVVYSNEAKVALAGVDADLIERVGAVSTEVAEALAEGARERLGSDVGVGITGIAGPGGGTEDKPVGTVCFSVVGPAGRLTRRVQLPGSRPDVRDRSTAVALHMVRRLMLGETD